MTLGSLIVSIPRQVRENSLQVFFVGSIKLRRKGEEQKAQREMFALE